MKHFILAFLVCLSAAAFAQKTNFSGSWQIDTLKTSFQTDSGDAPHYVLPRLMTVEQQDAKLTLSRIQQDQNLQDRPAVVETLALDGTPLQQMEREYPTTVSLHWLNNASFSLTRDGANKATETWTLEDGGRTLVIDRYVEQKSDGLKYRIKAYYSKTQ